MIGDPLPSLTALKAFEVAARQGSFQSAAKFLHLTPSAVSHQIRSLEKELGQPLFVRGHRKVELTEAGRTLELFVARGFEELRRGATALRQDRPAHVLRVTAAPAFASTYLTHRIEAFEAANAGFELRLDITHASADLDLEPIDVAIHLGRTPPPGRHSDLLTPVMAAPVCAPAMAERLRTPADLREAMRLCVEEDPRGWRAWLRTVDMDGEEPGEELWLNSLSTAIESAIDGRGLALAPLTLVAQHVQDGRLVIPFPQTVRSRFNYRLVCRSGEENLPKIARFREWLKAETA